MGIGANTSFGQARWIEKGFCEADAGCGCFRYRGDEVGDCLDEGMVWVVEDMAIAF